MKILVVLPRFPYPLEKGDKLRAYHQIVELAKRHDIYLFCVSHKKVATEDVDVLRPHCKEIRIVPINKLVAAKNIVANWLASKSLQLGYWNTAAAKRAYRKFESQVQPDIVYNQMVRTMPLVARSQYPKVMDFQDALSLNAERRMERTRGLMRYILHYEFKMLRSSEYNAFSIFDDLTIISEVDSEAIPHKKNGEIKIVPNGVDFDYFSPQALSMPITHDIVFAGNMSYAPNVNAAHYLVEEIMPLVWVKRPETTVLLAGAAPKHSVSRLAEDGRVTVSGWLDDIRTAYASSRLFIAPMRIGSGLQNKLLEAMAMHLPCVTTAICNSSLGAEEGRQVLVGNTPAQLADNILSLLHDTQRADTLAEEGSRFVHQHYGWPAAVAKLESVLNQVMQKR
ncbi:MAG: glycosyltransferase [Bacteroidales bacterium]|nr:glycosyltransferase [Bacteroidales bacterium]